MSQLCIHEINKDKCDGKCGCTCNPCFWNLGDK